MRLKKCLEIGRDCGLKTVRDSYVNIDLHAINIFKYDEIYKELKELSDEFNVLYKEGKLNADTSIEDALEILNNKGEKQYE